MHLRFFHRLKSATQRDLTNAAIIVAILVAALGVLASYIYAYNAETQRTQDYTRAKQQQLRATTSYLQNTFVAYRQILLAGATAVNIKGVTDISSQDWRNYYNTNLVGTNFPGILALGLAKYVSAEDLTQYTESVQNEGFPEFRVTPEGNRSTYAPITYIEPLNELNKQAFGFDMYQESSRRLAMEYARDNGTFALTSPVVLRQPIATTSQTDKNALLYYPVYDGATIPTTDSERRSRLRGFVYIAIHVHGMMSSREVELKELGVSYTIEDISNQPATEIYTFRGGAIHSDDRIVGTFPVSARTWRLTMHVPRSILSKTASPALLFAGGLAASMLLGSIVYSLLKLRIGQMSNLHQTELQSTRDELIALASHQLRTPASSVRQYIGMLQQGYFGELTVEQLAIAEKAYASNDRQLEIIDQLLYVAKADAGQLILQVAPFDLANTIRDTLDAMMANASEKNIKLMVDLPRKLPIKADERFVRMIIENLVSNAIKYSYTGSEIKIRLTTTLGVAKIRVVDSGVGIADKDHDALFQKFSRIQNPLSATEGGSGLGLYLARKLAEAHGGNIVVSSRVGRGSRFTIILPLRSVPKESVIHITE